MLSRYCRKYKTYLNKWNNIEEKKYLILSTCKISLNSYHWENFSRKKQYPFFKEKKKSVSFAHIYLFNTLNSRQYKYGNNIVSEYFTLFIYHFSLWKQQKFLQKDLLFCSWNCFKQELNEILSTWRDFKRRHPQLNAKKKTVTK